VVYAVEVPDSWVHEVAKGSTEEAQFDQKACMFLTHVAAYQTTQRIKVLNSDPVGHNTNMEPRRNVSMNQTIPVGGLQHPSLDEGLDDLPP
jgi:hypothetical protein